MPKAADAGTGGGKRAKAFFSFKEQDSDEDDDGKDDNRIDNGKPMKDKPNAKKPAKLGSILPGDDSEDDKTPQQKGLKKSVSFTAGNPKKPATKVKAKPQVVLHPPAKGGVNKNITANNSSSGSSSSGSGNSSSGSSSGSSSSSDSSSTQNSKNKDKSK